MEANKLLQEATNEVFQWAKKFDEANSKLHLLQQEYDKINGALSGIRDAYSFSCKVIEDQQAENAALKTEYDKLKAHDDMAVSMLEVLRGEYEKLKGELCSLKQMAEFAKGVLEVVKTHKEVHPDIIQSAIQALSSYNTQTNNQNENNG